MWGEVLEVGKLLLIANAALACWYAVARFTARQWASNAAASPAASDELRGLRRPWWTWDDREWRRQSRKCWELIGTLSLIGIVVAERRQRGDAKTLDLVQRILRRAQWREKHAGRGLA